MAATCLPWSALYLTEWTPDSFRRDSLDSDDEGRDERRASKRHRHEKEDREPKEESQLPGPPGGVADEDEPMEGDDRFAWLSVPGSPSIAAM